MYLGIDIGSTTIKTVLCDRDGDILYSDYRRHNTDITATAAAMLADMAEKYPDAQVQAGFTGSVGMGYAETLGGTFVQEVICAAEVIRERYPDVKTLIDIGGEDSKMTLNGTGWGVGAQVGAHLRMTDELSLGFSYKSPVTLNIAGSADFSRHHSNMLADQGQVPHTIDTDVHSTVHLPDSFAVGLAYRPLENLSFEVGTVFTRWSTYDSMNIYFDSDFQSINHKKWRDGWNFNASVEYKPLDWWSLRAGFWYETPVINEDHSDFMVPSNGRTALTLGTGVEWNDFTVDFAYCHMWVNPTSYDKTDGHGILDSGYITGGNSKDTVANIYMLSFGYKF